MDHPDDYKDLLLRDILCYSINPMTRRSGEKLSSTQEQNTINDLVEFLWRRVVVLEFLPITSSNVDPDSIQPELMPSNFRLNYSPVKTTIRSCVATMGTISFTNVQTSGRWLYLIVTRCYRATHSVETVSGEDIEQRNALIGLCVKNAMENLTILSASNLPTMHCK